MSVQKIVRVYRWYEQCPHSQCSNTSVPFIELVLECVDQKSGHRMKVMEVLYDHPLKVQVHNNYHVFELVHSNDFRKYYPGVKCNMCERGIEDYFVHERFVFRYHDGSSWKDAELEESKILEFTLPTMFESQFDCD